MSSVPVRITSLRNSYPTFDGKPMGETDWHRKLINIHSAV
jgi:hypothetical protein